MHHRNHIFPFFLTLLALTLCGCWKSKNNASLPEKPPAVEGAAPQKEDKKSEPASATPAATDENKIETQAAPHIPATVRAENKSAIGFQISGVITKVIAKAGQVVKKGTLLATLEDTQARLDLKSAEIDLKSKNFTYALEKKKYARAEEQFKIGLISQGALDNSKNLLESAELAFNSAQNKLESQRFALTQTQLTAPFNGVISQSYKSIGDSVSPGNAVFDLVENNKFIVYAQIPIPYYPKIKAGMTLTISDPLREHKGQIVIKRVVPVMDNASRTFDIYADIVSFNRDLIPGEYIEIIL